MHPRIQELLTHLHQTRADLRAAVDAVPAERRRQRAAPDRWSVAEVLEHLAIVETRIAGMIAAAVAEAKVAGLDRETSDAPVLAEMNLAGLLDRSRRFTASEASQPSGTITAEEAWTRLEQARDRLKGVLQDVDGWALGTISRPHARLGVMNLYQWIGFTSGHEARHTAQIREIGAALG